MESKVTYTVSADPLAHLYTITMRFVPPPGPWVDLMLPVWTPGSYMVREYSRHVQDFTCLLPWTKRNKNTWRIQVPADTAEVTVSYRVYALELTVRTSHLDNTHGYFNGACLFLLCAPWRAVPHDLEILLPHPDWQITTALTQQAGNHFRAVDYDQLVDSPVEMGTHSVHRFEVLDKTHRLAIWGQGNYDIPSMLRDITRIIETTASIFGGLPYPEYLFIVHAADNYGGLEHANSTSLLYPRLNFQPQSKYERFLQLVAHEFFHTWNIKRLRPDTLDSFDYSQENYVSVLWFCEGGTAYYDEFICMRAGFYDDRRYLQLLSEAITRLETTPGKDVQSLTQSSFDAWIKLYRPDENSLNSSISYYLKGQVVMLLLDLFLRARGQGSLDTVFQELWRRYQSRGAAYSEVELWAVIEGVAGDLTGFYKYFIQGTQPLPYNEFLEPFGLHLTSEVEGFPYTGLRLGEDKPVLKAVETGSAAQQAGLCPGDELIALNGLRVTTKNWSDLLKCYAPGTRVVLTCFRRDELRSFELLLGDPQPSRYTLTPLPKLTAQQRTLYQAWLGKACSGSG
ncbi:M61 family metallopeptidase [Anthocerotibacter panamensis]|uniref:M61 family metallopeptidase n=1 Tax=Anthocerotibacter panamensis TaxID=2857077 RepID=UPI001C406FE1|nr:PDZ domain-containing protein [Anthocerotibacter panamensis]